jgi:hypothetical protein
MTERAPRRGRLGRGQQAGRGAVRGGQTRTTRSTLAASRVSWPRCGANPRQSAPSYVLSSRVRFTSAIAPRLSSCAPASAACSPRRAQRHVRAAAGAPRPTLRARSRAPARRARPAVTSTAGSAAWTAGHGEGGREGRVEERAATDATASRDASAGDARAQARERADSEGECWWAARAGRYGRAVAVEYETHLRAGKSANAVEHVGINAPSPLVSEQRTARTRAGTDA